MGKLKKKGMAGEANRFISRNKAIRKLQLNLRAFNRVCIIKGLFPIEPKNRMRAQKGDSKYRPLYLKKDIRFLMHDPLIWTIRDEMSSYKKLRKAKHRHDVSKEKTLKRNKPIYRLEQNVLERYPTFVDAVKDMSDSLTMIFLYAGIKSRKPVREHHVSRCQRLKMEFMTYVIESRCLTKAFISTKGYYYEAEIMGQKVVWVVPHNCVTEVPRNVDMRIMVNFLEFSIAMLGFVNFRLLGKVNLRYPLKPAHIPRLQGPEKNDLDNFKNLMFSLNYPLERTVDERQTEEEANNIDGHLIEGSTKLTQKAYTESLESVERRKLFAGLKFFISQENNRESLTMIIRSCGGEVSWPSTVFPCSTFGIDDQCITHQIVDRPNVEKKHLSRYYIQPQWVYDSINSVTLHPCQSYFPDTPLPPHVCPFLKNYDGWYVPPEEETLRKLLEATPEEKDQILQKLIQDEQQRLAMMRAIDTETVSDDDEDDDMEDEDIEEKITSDEKESSSNNDEEKNTSSDAEETGDMDVAHEEEDESEVEKDENDNENDDENNESDGEVENDKQEEVPKKPELRRGRELIINQSEELAKEEFDDYKMKAMMIHNRNRGLYKKLRHTEHKNAKKSNRLKDRREAIEQYKVGKISKDELDYPVKKVVPMTMHEKKSQSYNRRIKEAVAFSKSSGNKNRNKKTVKK